MGQELNYIFFSEKPLKAQETHLGSGKEKFWTKYNLKCCFEIQKVANDKSKKFIFVFISKYSRTKSKRDQILIGFRCRFVFCIFIDKRNSNMGIKR